MSHHIRPATMDDVPYALDTLTTAFADYPWTRHTVDSDHHLDRIRRFQEIFLVEIGLRHGRVWVSDDRAAVAVWTTPDFTDAPAVFARLGPQLGEIAGDRAAASAAAENAMAPHRPGQPAWFLGSVGVDPKRQGEGLGKAVIQPGLDAADAAGSIAYLETSTESNVEFYRRLGFDVDAVVELPDDGPLTWAMTRKPRL